MAKIYFISETAAPRLQRGVPGGVLIVTQQCDVLAEALGRAMKGDRLLLVELVSVTQPQSVWVNPHTVSAVTD